MRLRTIVCLCAMIAVIGCGGGGPAGPKLVKVTGKVNYNGKPVTGATVTMTYDQPGPLCNGFTNSAGQFTVTTGGRPGAMIGNAKVSIVKASAASNKPEMKPEDLAKMAVEGGYKQEDMPKPEIPVKYANPQTSGLTAAVVADAAQNSFEFNLVD